MKDSDDYLADLTKVIGELKLPLLTAFRLFGDADIAHALADANWTLLNALMSRGFTREEAMQLLAKQQFHQGAGQNK